ncbi:MAG: cytochrome c [Planctomycetes bacterium]|nr:cytochrome c [Planctomycetota bacterium]
MSYRMIAALCLMLAFTFAGIGLIQGQDQNKDAKKEAKGDEKPDKKDEKAEDKPLTKKEFDVLMEEIEDAWNKLKFDNRKKMGDKAAESADTIAEAAVKIMRYDGEVLKGDDKGKKARDQKDFKEWVEALEKAAKDYSKYAKKGDWDKASEAKDKINESCGNCHDAYEPEEED